MKPNDPQAPGDGALLTELIDGKVTALERLYDRHAGALYALALRIAANPAKAESAVEAAFTDLWSTRRSLEAPRHRIPPALWLMARCRARALEGAGLAPSAEHDIALLAPQHRIDALLALDPGTRGDRVRRALAALPEAQRVAVEKAYFDGARLSRIASEQGRAPRDVARDLKHGLAAIGAGLEGATRPRSVE